MTRNVMLTEDYLIRQINIYLAAIARIMGFKTAYMFVEAQIAVDEALEEIFGLSANLVRSMDDQGLLDAVTYLDVLNVDKLQAAADVFREEGELKAMRGDEVGSIQSYTRSLNFYLDVVLNGGAWNLPDPANKIDKLIELLEPHPLDPDTIYGIFLYSEKQENWSRAERILNRLAEFPDLTEQLLKLRNQFYQHLNALDDKVLESSGMNRHHVQQMIEYYQNQA